MLIIFSLWHSINLYAIGCFILLIAKVKIVIIYKRICPQNYSCCYNIINLYLQILFPLCLLVLLFPLCVDSMIVRLCCDSNELKLKKKQFLSFVFMAFFLNCFIFLIIHHNKCIYMDMFADAEQVLLLKYFIQQALISE